MLKLTLPSWMIVAALLVAFVPLIASSDDQPRASYFKNGEIHITSLGSPETKPITTGHWDFKPSWSRTDDRLVFFRRLKDDPEVNNWITALCIINADGTESETKVTG